MVRHFLLGTAGHVDHGKTTLIKALTGTDTDRLPEEKQRGLTVDIGFAALEHDDLLFGIVDVPGHERFVKNMLAGATGIDLVLLVVACDEGVMLQTIEHFEVLRHLQVRAGVVVITKCDLVDKEILSLVQEDISNLVAGSFLQDAPIVNVSSKTGSGLEELRTTLSEVANRLPQRNTEGHFRMPIDRCFTVPGHGTIVTGSVASGKVSCGEKLHVFPRTRAVTVRSIESHGESLQCVGKGQRAALNLSGVRYNELVRGDILATQGSVVPSKLLSVQFEAGKSSSQILKSRHKIRFYSGTSETVGLLRLPGDPLPLPGETQVGQLELEDAVHTVWGEAFVLRGLAEGKVLGGGRIVDPVAPRLNLNDNDKCRILFELFADTESQRLAAMAALSGTLPWSAEELAQRTGANEYESALEDLHSKGLIRSFDLKGNRRWLHIEKVSQLERRLLKSVSEEHKKQPARPSVPFSQIRAYFKMIDPPELLDQLAGQLCDADKLMFKDAQVALSDWKPELSELQAEHLSKIVTTCRQAALTPPSASEMADLLVISLEEVELLLELAVSRNQLLRLPDKDTRDAKASRRARLHLHPQTCDYLVEQLGSRLKQHSQWTLSQFCEAFEVSRKYAIPLCGFLDKNGITKRSGDARSISQQIPTNEDTNDTTYVR